MVRGLRWPLLALWLLQKASIFWRGFSSGKNWNRAIACRFCVRNVKPAAMFAIWLGDHLGIVSNALLLLAEPSVPVCVGAFYSNTKSPPPPCRSSGRTRKSKNQSSLSSVCKKVRLAGRSRWGATHPSRGSPSTSRRFALSAKNIFLVGKNPTCSVPLHCREARAYGHSATGMHCMIAPMPTAAAARFRGRKSKTGGGRLRGDSCAPLARKAAQIPCFSTQPFQASDVW